MSILKAEAKKEYDRLYRLRPERAESLKIYREKNKEEIAARMKRWNEKNKESQKQKKHDRYLKNKEAVKERVKIYNNKNKTKIKLRYLKKYYNLTPKQYYELLNSQDYKCAGCGVPQEELNKPLCVDHNHDTGEVRGLLCMKCNFTLGNVDDNPTILRQLIAYLESE